MAVEKVTKVVKPVKSGAGKKMYVSVDNNVQDVLDYVESGCTLLFEDDKDKFLELPTEVYKVLPLADKERYMLAKELVTNGINKVTQTVTDGINGWSRDFDMTPGTPGDKLKVLNKDKGYEYRWSRPDRLGKRSGEGWEIDRDPNIRTYEQSNSDIGQAVPKAVGGQRAPELLLVRRKKDVALKFRQDKAEKYNSYTDRAKDGFKEGAEKVGAKAVIED